LWQRNGNFIARTTIEDEADVRSNAWVPLKDPETLAQ
jgi:hypothetical protein